MSVNDNDLYLDFWEPVSMVWNMRFGIRPLLIYFGQKNLSTEWGDVIRTPYVDNIPKHFQTQWARFWFTQTEPNSTFIISDIDMIPISKFFFRDQISLIDCGKYVHLNGYHRPLPVCYHVAKGDRFREVLDLEDDFGRSVRKVWGTNFSSKDKLHNGNSRWSLDEAYSTNKIIGSNLFNNPMLCILKKIFSKKMRNIELIKRKVDEKYLRIDRSKWPVDIPLNINEYFDCHCPRPYADYSKSINKIISSILT